MIDADVHCTPRLEDLFPYLEPHWKNLIEVGGITMPFALEAAYPPEAPTSGGGGEASLSALAAAVFGSSGQPDDLAILSPLTGFESLRNTYYSAALFNAVNEWVAEQWLDREPRLRASIAVPTLDPVAAAAEIELRAGDPRFVQVLLPIRADAPFGDRRYEPVLEAAARHGLPLALHAWGMPGAPPAANGFSDHYFEDYVSNSLIVQAHLSSLIAHGSFDRFAGLRVSVLECGFSWLPSLLWRLDKDWKGIRREVPWMSRRPSAVISERVRFGLAPIHAPKLLSDLTAVEPLDRWQRFVMFTSDYPHRHGDRAAELLATLSEEDRRRVLTGNAEEHFLLGRGVSEPRVAAHPEAI